VHRHVGWRQRVPSSEDHEAVRPLQGTREHPHLDVVVLFADPAAAEGGYTGRR
jgi:hypothetical protein